METYRYKAVSRDGADVTGVVEAYDEFEAVAKIKENCPIVVKVDRVAQKRERIDLNEPLWVSDKVLSLTCSQFAILLKAGLPLSRTVEVIANQTADKLMKKILLQVAQDTAAGYSMAQSFETRGKKLPLTFIETVRAGEESGTLETSFAKMEIYYQKAHKTKSKVKGALMYPVFLCVLAVVVVAVLMVAVVPNLLGVISTNGGEVPLPTQMLISLSDFFVNSWWLLVVVILVLVLGVKAYAGTPGGKMKLAGLAMKIPVWGQVNRTRGASQFANTLSTLVAAGLPLGRAMTITGRVVDNYALGTALGTGVMGIEEGKKLGDVLRLNPYLPSLLTEMVGVGEESGSLEDTLDTIGAYYDSEAESAAAKVLAMLEPAITVVIGVVIGFIVIALYAGMFATYTV